MEKRKSIQLLIEFWVDLFSLFFANCFAYIISLAAGKMPEMDSRSTLVYAACAILSYCVIFFGFSVSLDLTKRDRLLEIISVLRNCLLAYMTMIVLLVMTRNAFMSCRVFLVVTILLFTLFSGINRYFTKHLMMYRFSHSDMVSLAGIVTVSSRAEELTKQLDDDWLRRIKGIVLLDASNCNGNYRVQKSAAAAGSTQATKTHKRYKDVKEIGSIPVVGNFDNFMDWIRSESLDEVFINIPFEYENDMEGLIEEIESMGIIVHINLPNLEKLVEKSKFSNVDCTMIAGYPTATLTASSQISLSKATLKRFFDIIGGLFGSILSLPIILIVAIPLLIESPGPLIFKQPRVGKNGRIFNIYKLRSMYVDAEERKRELMEQNKMNGLMFKMDNDPRITKVGRFIRKTSIDELPQFWNVLKGDMSLVGTRPPTVDEFSQYESHHKRRLSMRPGITGMWQVSGRSDIVDFEEVVRLDCEYIDNWSIWLDFKIAFKTIGVVLKRSGAE